VSSSGKFLYFKADVVRFKTEEVNIQAIPRLSVASSVKGVAPQGVRL